MVGLFEDRAIHEDAPSALRVDYVPRYGEPEVNYMGVIHYVDICSMTKRSTRRHLLAEGRQKSRAGQ